MIELREELVAMPMYDWRCVPITVNRHKWWLKMHRSGDDGNFLLCFESPKKRRYSYYTERGRNGRVRVIDADITLANGKRIASYWEAWGDGPERMDAVIRLTPKHILRKLSMLLDAIG